MLKHEEDDKELGIFATGDEIVIACKGGHFWLLPVTQYSTTPTRRSTELQDVREKFPQALQFMNEG